MKIHNLIQGSHEWLAYRAQHFNASDAPAMMGCSPYKTRAELLRELHTGVPQEVDTATQRSYDNGHRAEALARPLAEEFVGAEFYPTTGSEGRLSASFDGLTLDGLICFEHKALNNELRKCFAQMETINPAHREKVEGRELPIYHRIQMEQQLLVSGAERVLFMTSKWNDEELVDEKHCWYYPDLKLRQEIVDGWAQFEKDMATFSMPAAAAPLPAGKAPETLPALHIEVTGAVTASNLAEFKKTALAAISSVNRDLKTDQDFADAAKAVKWCADIEERLQAAKQHALSQTASIDALFKAMDDIGAESKRVRIELSNLVTKRKTEVKEEAVLAARSALLAHYQALNQELAPAMLQLPIVGFADAIKGLRSFDSMQAALDALLAKAKIDADGAARTIRTNQTTFKRTAAGFEFLYPDLAQLLLKQPDDFQAVLVARHAAHQQAELDRQEEQRAQIRAEEEQRQAAERQRQARLDAERAARVDMRISQMRDAETALVNEPAAVIEAKWNQIKATEPTEDLFGERVAEAVELRSRVLIALGDQLAAAKHEEAQQQARAEAARVAAAAPAPVAAPAPQVRAFTPAPAASNEQPTLTLGQIGTRLGFSPSTEFLAGLGFVAHKDRSARLYRPSDFPAICKAISAHVLRAAEEQRAAA
jgi:putative phage-type endonuclease